jgi:hypothetical protein
MKRSSILSVLALFAGFVLNASAAVVVVETWETGGNSEGWDAQTSIGTATRDPDPPAQGGPVSTHTGALRFGVGADVAGVDQDFISELNGNVVNEFNDADIQSITFDFYANANAGGNGGGVVAPASLFLYFQTAVDGYVWYYDILAEEGIPGAAGWYNYDANVVPAAGWVNDDGRLDADFLTDMGNASQVGVWISYQNWSDQDYAIDNFLLDDMPLGGGAGVPEPGFWLLLSMALISIVVPFRNHLPAVVSVRAVR